MALDCLIDLTGRMKMLILVEVALAIIATKRGWRFWPALLVVTTYVFDVVIVFVIGPIGVSKSSPLVLALPELILIGVLIVMAILGQPAQSQPADALPSTICLGCGLPNLAEARMCLYCGYSLRSQSHVVSSRRK
jgi:hypothetical protein